MLISLLFSYLISRFRRREIAVLKALGYSNGSVRTALVAESITISLIGFFVGLGSAQAILMVNLGRFERNALFSLTAIGVSFLTIVVITLPGILFISRRVLKISPAEAFRDN